MSAVMGTIARGASKVLPAIPIVGDIVSGISSLFKKRNGGGQIGQSPGVIGGGQGPQITTKPYNPGIGGMVGGMIDQGRNMFNQGREMFNSGMNTFNDARNSWQSGDYGGAISRFGQGMGDLVSRGQGMFRQGQGMFRQGQQMMSNIRDEYRRRNMAGYGYY